MTYEKNQLYMHPIGIHCHIIRFNDWNECYFRTVFLTYVKNAY